VRSTGKTVHGTYPVQTGISANSARIDRCVVDGAERVGICYCENIRDTVIRNVRGAAISNTSVSDKRSAVIENVTIENVGTGFRPQAANKRGKGSTVTMRNVRMSKLRSNCVAVNDHELDTLNVEDCAFTDYGLDDKLPPPERAAFGGRYGFRGKVLNLTNVKCVGNAPTASSIKVLADEKHSKAAWRE
jgi:hypothetical protein